MGHGAGGRIYVDRLVTLQGSREAPVQMAVVEQPIREVAEAFAPVDKIRIMSARLLCAHSNLRVRR